MKTPVRVVALTKWRPASGGTAVQNQAEFYRSFSFLGEGFVGL